MVKVKCDLTEKIFGRLKVLGQAEDYISPLGRHMAQWLCQCSCGSKPIVVQGASLTRGVTKSCGCLHKERCAELGKSRKKSNIYDLSGDYGIGWTSNKNNEFYFDLKDYDLIKDYCWYERVERGGYNPLVAYDPNTRKHIKMTAILGCKNYDHINKNPLDNRRSNLRHATISQNGMNVNLRTNNTSGITGVCWHKSKEKWFAYIEIENNRINLGYFSDFNEAVKARLRAEQKYYQEFAPQQHLYEKYGLLEVQSQREGHLFVCSHCLCAIEAHEGNQIYREWGVDPDDERQSKCDWCEESGFCTLNEIL